MADDAGALLVRSGLVSSSSLDDARARVATLGGTLGEQLVAGGAIADDALTDFYRSRLLVPQVNPNTLARLSAKVVGTIPGDMAIELRAIPVSLDAENNLTVAMGDPSDRHAVDEIAWFTGTYVVRAVATQMQIAWCLAHYYGHVTALGQRLLKTSGSESPIKVSAAVARPPRTRGLTGKVEATRHHAVAPVSGPVDLARPTSGELDLAPLAAAIAKPAAEPRAVDAVPPADTAPHVQPATDGTPDQRRARSISGEIRVPVRRAESIRPPMPDPLEDDDADDEGQVITIEAGSADEDPTGPSRVAPQRRRMQKSNPPELRERAGEVSLAGTSDRAIDADEPRIVIDQGALAPVASVEISGEMTAVPHHDAAAPPAASVELLDEADTGAVASRISDADSAPILLEKARAKRPGTDDEDTGERNVVALERRKPPTPRPERRTKVGIGAMPAVTRPHHDTETSGVPTMMDDAPTAAETRPDDPTTVDMRPAPPGDETTSDQLAAPPAPASADDTNPNIIAPPPGPAPRRAPSPTVIVEDLEDDADEDEPAGPRTAVMSALELDDAIPERSSDVVPAHLAKRHQPNTDNYDPLDEGWGPPGTTIPPPLLGAIPGSDDRSSASSIPVPDVDSAPLIVAPPSLPLPSAGETSGPTKATLARALDEATERAMSLIRTLERTQTRDEVVDVMIAHLAETHHRAGFFVTRASAPKGPVELSVFAIKPRPPLLPTVTLRLDRPSTLQDVVGTRLPYRGPMHDDASRSFLTSVLGACPPEILLVPIAIRERVVGVLFGEHRFRYTFDDQLALAARAAGMALERVLKARRG